jgi:hypothetical protein
MSVLVHDMAFRCPQVFFPLLLDMDQCPLPSAKYKMLYA